VRQSKGIAITAPIQGSENPDLVLVAEDDEGIALALEILIEDAGYRVAHAVHGEQALAMARELHPALIFTDLMMPRMNGEQLIEVLQQDATSSGRPLPHIVLMTAARSPHASEIPADAYLPKPFDVDQVFMLLDRFMSNTGATT
jgi:CheY-like chemotaxis protein